MEPHLWSYRQRVSLEHLGQTLQEKKLKEKYPILHEFLRVVSEYENHVLVHTVVMLGNGSIILMQEPSLRATQYLPDIVKLQQCLYDSFHHRLDRTDARTLTIGDFLEKLSSGMILEFIV